MFVNIFVRNPILEHGNYISYAVLVETNDPSFSLEKSISRRRYSEFHLLREILIRQCPAMKPPPLPSKSPFSNRLKPSFIEKRRLSLESFLLKLVQTTVYLSSKTFHLFLQSSYTMKEIKDIVEEKQICVVSINVESLSQRFEEVCCCKSLTIQNTTENSQDIKIDENVLSDEIPCSHIGSVNSDQYIANVNSLSNRKRVSFCDNVIVAQVHV